MRHPAPVTCDFCKAPIDTTTPWTTVQAVVPRDVADDVRDAISRTLQPRAGDVLNLFSAVQVPTHCQVDMCSSCEQRLVPDLRPQVAVAILTSLDKQRRAGAFK